ncbi:MAG TPA: GDSL-type esterase/lipase family protein [Burkholderiaceae bacterium]|nr:GDSL-type esterase/lipase family protein [Burkholderiaceae bacterium]
MHAPDLIRKPGIVVPLLLLSGALLEMAVFWRGIERAHLLAASGRRFERHSTSHGVSILVLGDSTGVGVGADLPEESIAGLIARDFPDANIVNISESGARVSNTFAQVQGCEEAAMRFDVAVLHVGGNDIVVGTPNDLLEADCDMLLSELARVARRTVWLGPPNLGSLPLFPLSYSWVMGARSKAAIAVFSRCADRHGAAFVDFSAPSHAIHFGRWRREHFAADGFHPNSRGYRYGYVAAREAMGLRPES